MRFGPGLPRFLQISHIFSRDWAKASTTIEASVAWRTSKAYMHKATLCIHTPWSLALGRSFLARAFVSCWHLGTAHLLWSIPSWGNWFTYYAAKHYWKLSGITTDKQIPAAKFRYWSGVMHHHLSRVKMPSSIPLWQKGPNKRARTI